MIRKTLLFLAIGFPFIESKSLPRSVPWVAKIQDHLSVAPGGAISAKKHNTGSTTSTLTSSSLSLQGKASWTGNLTEGSEQPIVIQKRNGTTEPLNKDKVRT
jgi:hypothetical protein